MTNNLILITNESNRWRSSIVVVPYVKQSCVWNGYRAVCTVHTALALQNL